MEKPKALVTARYVIGSLILAIGVPYLPLPISQHWDWWEGWTFAILCTLGFVASRWLATRRHPDILIERGRILQQEDAKWWDKILTPIWFICFVLIVVVAGVDKLSGWSPGFSLPVSIISLIIFLAGYIFGSSAMLENKFFSGMNRIQTERGHHVVSTGPYSVVRHPGYAGSIVSYIAIPFLLGSWWACVPLLLFIGAVILRTSLEDNMLQNELEGYRQYAQRVRYRLFPGIW